MIGKGVFVFLVYDCKWVSMGSVDAGCGASSILFRLQMVCGLFFMKLTYQISNNNTY